MLQEQEEATKARRYRFLKQSEERSGGTTRKGAATRRRRQRRLVACCKSKMKQPGPGGTGLESRAREKYFTFYLELEKIQVDGGRNYYSTCFDFLSLVRISKNHEKVLPGTSLFHPEASVNQPNQVKPTLLSLLFWNGLSGGSCFHC